MIPKRIFYFIAIAIIFCTTNGCGKKHDDSVPATNPNAIDVYAQWQIDVSGQIMTSINDGQWQEKTFTTQEMALFNSLDTANLTGTTTPDSLVDVPGYGIYIYPNPSYSIYNQHFHFTNGYTGQYVYKLVFVDSLMNPVYKQSYRLECTGGTNFYGFTNALPAGRYRLYYTLSSEADPHFFKTWGNVQKNQ